MILTDEQLAARRAGLMSVVKDREIFTIERDYLDTITDLKRQLTERDKVIIPIPGIIQSESTGQYVGPAGNAEAISFPNQVALDAYVQEKVEGELSDQHHGACNHRHQAIGGPGCVCEVICRGELQQAVDRAVLAESEWYDLWIRALRCGTAEESRNIADRMEREHAKRLAANRANVGIKT